MAQESKEATPKLVVPDLFRIINVRGRQEHGHKAGVSVRVIIHTKYKAYNIIYMTASFWVFEREEGRYFAFFL